MTEPFQLPDGLTIKGKRLSWRHTPLVAHDPLTAWNGLLAARGLQAADPFFTPRLADLPDPLQMQDMARAATRLTEAILAREPIHVFGDFDADGVNGTAILLVALRAAGAEVSSSIPHRAEQGHGIGEAAVAEVVARGVRVGLSVDTGTTCFAACDAAKAAGLDLIVTDHHLPEKDLPAAYALLNPARADCGFADRQLCGTGVAFFLLMAVWRLLGERGQRPDFDLRTLLDRVAVATIADVMDLVGVNRILVHHGLARLNSAPSVGLKALMQVARVKKAVTAETIGFYLAPRINAAGRLQHGEVAMRLLSTNDAAEAAQLAAELDAINKERRQVETEAFKQAELILGDGDVLALYDQRWHAGVVGLVAGRLARKHGKPAAVGFVDPQGGVRVSLRGYAGFHVGQILHACAAHLDGFGGHAGAGGGSVKAGQWDGFVASFAAAIDAQSADAADHLELLLDGVLHFPAMHAGLAERLRYFEPIGRGNPPCLWLLPEVTIAERREMKGGVVRLKLTDGSRWLDAIVFKAGQFGDALARGVTLSLLGQLQLDQWRGNGAVQFVVEDAIL